MTPEQAQEAIRQYKMIAISVVDVPLESALRLAAALGIYAYDSYMLLCASDQRSPLLTLDGGLRHAAARAKVEVLEVGP